MIISKRCELPTDLFAEKRVIRKILLHLIRSFCLQSSVSASRPEKVMVERKVLRHKLERKSKFCDEKKKVLKDSD